MGKIRTYWWNYNRAFLMLAILLLAFPGISQNTFSKLYYSDSTSVKHVAIAPVGNNGYLLGGEAGSSIGPDALLTRIDSAGNILFSKRIGDTGSESFHFVTKTHDSCFVFVGESRLFSTATRKIILIKVNAAGDTLWCQRSTGSPTEFAKTVYECADHGFIVSGSVNGSGLLAKYDSVGTLEWKKEIQVGTLSTTCNSARQMSDGGYIAAISHYDPPYELVGTVIKFAADGSFSWGRKYSVPGDTLYAYCLDVMENSGELIVFRGGIGLIKTDLSGNVLSATYTSGWGTGSQTLHRSSGSGELLFVSENYIDTVYSAVLVSLYPSGAIHHVQSFGFPGFESSLAEGTNGFAIIGCEKLHTIGSPTAGARFRTGIVSTDTAFNSACYPDPPLPSPTTMPYTSTLITPPVITLSGGSERFYPAVNNKLVNVDSGCFEIITSIPETIAAETFNVFPNPSQGNFEIQVNKEYQISGVILYDIYGRKALTNTINKFTNILQLDASEIPSGLYIVELRIENKSLKKKIIITH